MLKFMSPDTGPLVAQSIEEGKPIVLVTINYRLNIFAQGGADNEKNLDLQDQTAAIQWVRSNIADFGGDPVSTYPALFYSSS